MKALLEAAPETALLRDNAGLCPLDLALRFGAAEVACCLLEGSPLPVTEQLLAALQPVATLRHGHGWRRHFISLPVYAFLVERFALTPAVWACVPSPSPSLAPALPAVLARSEAEAGQLVHRLPDAVRMCLQFAALCQARVERVHGLQLPPDLHRALLMAAAGL